MKDPDHHANNAEPAPATETEKPQDTTNPDSLKGLAGTALLKELRLQTGLTQQRLAVALGITRSVYSDAERGRRCSPPVAAAIARYYKRPVEQLFPHIAPTVEETEPRKRQVNETESFSDFLYREGLVGVAYDVIEYWLKKKDREMAKWVISQAHRTSTGRHEKGNGEDKQKPEIPKGLVLNLPTKDTVPPPPAVVPVVEEPEKGNDVPNSAKARAKRAKALLRPGATRDRQASQAVGNEAIVVP